MCLRHDRLALNARLDGEDATEDARCTQRGIAGRCITVWPESPECFFREHASAFKGGFRETNGNSTQGENTRSKAEAYVPIDGLLEQLYLRGSA